MILFEYKDEIQKLPDNFVQEIINHDTENRSWFKDDNYKFYRCSEELKSWVRDNVKLSFGKIGIQEMWNDIQPHKDPNRNYALNYLIKTGDADLCYYTSNSFYKRGTYISLDKCKEIARFKPEPFRWHIISTSYLHAVVGVTFQRISLTIDLND